MFADMYRNARAGCNPKQPDANGLVFHMFMKACTKHFSNAPPYDIDMYSHFFVRSEINRGKKLRDVCKEQYAVFERLHMQNSVGI